MLVDTCEGQENDVELFLNKTLFSYPSTPFLSPSKIETYTEMFEHSVMMNVL